MNRRTLGPIPVSGAWTPQDPIAFRKFAQLGPLRLENGSFLPEVTLAYETLGTLNEDRSNAILVLHALTGDAHISGSTAPGQSTTGWWEEAVGPGKPLDPERYFIVVPNVLGGCQGSRGVRVSLSSQRATRFRPRRGWRITSGFPRGTRSSVPPWADTALSSGE